MKEIGIALLVATFSLNLFCQQDSLIVKDSSIAFLWDTITNDWLRNGRNVYCYNANGKITDRAYYRWDSEDNDWVGIGGRTTFEYDANGNIKEEVVHDT